MLALLARRRRRRRQPPTSTLFACSSTMAVAAFVGAVKLRLAVENATTTSDDPTPSEHLPVPALAAAAPRVGPILSSAWSHPRQRLCMPSHLLSTHVMHSRCLRPPPQSMCWTSWCPSWVLATPSRGWMRWWAASHTETRWSNKRCETTCWVLQHGAGCIDRPRCVVRGSR